MMNGREWDINGNGNEMGRTAPRERHRETLSLCMMMFLSRCIERAALLLS